MVVSERVCLNLPLRRSASDLVESPAASPHRRGVSLGRARRFGPDTRGICFHGGGHEEWNAESLSSEGKRERDKDVSTFQHTLDRHPISMIRGD